MVSVVIPVYNGEKYLNECLDSVVSQSYSDTEILLLDDGSTDSTETICQSYANRFQTIKYFRLPHRGLSETRNRGIEEASGDYIAFVDADDVLHPFYIELLLKSIINHRIALCVIQRVKNPEIKEVTPRPRRRIIDAEKATCRMLYQTGIPSTVFGKLFSHDLFDKIRFQENTFYEDLLIMPQLFSQVKEIVQIDVPLYYYRNHPSSFINSFSEKQFDLLKVTEQLEIWSSSRSPEVKKGVRDRKLSASFNILRQLYKNKISSPENEIRCVETIRQYRRESLLNPHTRLKNKLGAIISYFGINFYKNFSAWK